MTNDFDPGDRKAVIKHLASTAAVERISQSLSLRQPRAPRHPASGYEKWWMNESGAGSATPTKSAFEGRTSRSRETNRNTQPVAKENSQIRGSSRNLRRRIIAAAVLGTLTLVAPAIASATPAPRKEVRVPRIHATAIENLQRWVSEEEDSLYEAG
jgi:hypothetical protein